METGTVCAIDENENIGMIKIWLVIQHNAQGKSKWILGNLKKNMKHTWFNNDA